jgi:hypothetical protein
MDALASVGVTEIAFDIQPGDGTTVRGELDRLAELVADRRGLLRSQWMVRVIINQRLCCPHVC